MTNLSGVYIKEWIISVIAKQTHNCYPSDTLLPYFFPTPGSFGDIEHKPASNCPSCVRTVSFSFSGFSVIRPPIAIYWGFDSSCLVRLHQDSHQTYFSEQPTQNMQSTTTCFFLLFLIHPFFSHCNNAFLIPIKYTNHQKPSCPAQSWCIQQLTRHTRSSIIIHSSILCCGRAITLTFSTRKCTPPGIIPNIFIRQGIFYCPFESSALVGHVTPVDQKDFHACLLVIEIYSWVSVKLLCDSDYVVKGKKKQKGKKSQTKLTLFWNVTF